MKISENKREFILTCDDDGGCTIFDKEAILENDCGDWFYTNLNGDELILASGKNECIRYSGITNIHCLLAPGTKQKCCVTTTLSSVS